MWEELKYFNAISKEKVQELIAKGRNQTELSSGKN